MQTQVDSQQFRRCVVRVEGALGGTGFFIATGWVLTCAHIVGEETQVNVVPELSVFPNPVQATVVARSAPRTDGALWPFPDMALLRLTGPIDHPCVLLDPRFPLSEQDSHAWGFPPREPGLPPPGSPATFRFEGVEGDGYLKLKSGQAQPGLSGAPLLCPGRRAVVGVITASRHIDSDLGGWATPVAALLDGALDLPGELPAYSTQIREGNRAAVLADRGAWHRVLPIENANTVLDQPWTKFVKHSQSSPANLLLAGYGVVPYLFRDSEVADIIAWCEADTPMAVAQVAGTGGAGKTRFAIEVCQQLAARGWVAGLWPDLASGAGAVRAAAATTLPLPRLVVLDYVEAVSTDTLRTTLDDLRRHATPIAPVRVLLLTRTGGCSSSVLDKIGQRAQPALHTVLDAAQDHSAAAQALTVVQRRDLYAKAFTRFTDAWTPDSTVPTELIPCPVPDLTGANYAQPLMVLFEAFDHALTSSQDTGDRRPAVDRVLDHEQRYWDATAPAKLDPDLRRPCVALATLAGAPSTTEANNLLASTLPILDGDTAGPLRQSVARWLAGLYEGPAYFNPLRPDRLGEALVAQFLARHRDSEGTQDGGASLLTIVLALSSDDQVAQCLDMLARLSAYNRTIADTVGSVLASNHTALVNRAESQAQGPGHQTDSAIARKAAL